MNSSNNPYANVFVPVRNFFKMEASAGICLVVASVIAIIIANTGFYDQYNYLLNETLFQVGFSTVDSDSAIKVKKSVLLWINDGFMAIFFLLVGLEIKREIVSGELSTRSRALLPAIAAVGGMAVPALIYYYINMDSPNDLRGWAIPAATDIAFSLGVLSLLGSRAPVRLKILLTAIAVIDDLGAILIIAFFYTSDIVIGPLYVAGACLAGLLFLNRRNHTNIAPYIILGTILWVAVLKSGVHATLAGVLTALFIPMMSKKNPEYSPCKALEHALHPWVAFAILPIFAFANAGVPFKGMGLESLLEPVTLGIMLGLFIGKQVGIFTAIWLTIKLGVSPMIKGVRWIHLYAVAMLCGIGFTMSLFIGGLAFEDLHHQASIRLGVLVGSILSAIVGFLILRFGPPAHDPDPGEE